MRKLGIHSVQSERKKKRVPPVSFFLAGLALGGAFMVYLASLDQQLTDAFFKEEQLIPIRIYSDVSRIQPGARRAQIETQLKSLGYSPVEQSQSLSFSLNPRNYPAYLIPDGHPQQELGDHSENAETPVRLGFEKPGPNAPLVSLELRGTPVDDLYLEPELIATLSRSGEVKKEIRTSLQFSQIPAPLWKAIIAIEDHHFLDHKGLDPKAIARAFFVNLRTLSFAQGGSTITQQLVKNLLARHTKNIFRKLNEVLLSLLLELRMEKEQILERYLNEVYLGQVGPLEIHGVAEGAQSFFGKTLDELNLAEIALMAGIIRGPGYYSPYHARARAIERSHLVLRKMVETGQIAEEEAQAALSMPIRLAPPLTSATKAPYFSDYVKAELFHLLQGKLSEEEVLRSGFKVYTTLDLHLNQLASQVVSREVLRLEKSLKLPSSDRLEGLLAAVDHSKGHIKALVGGRDYSKSTFNRILNMKRQVGSTFKPIVYLTAFQQKTDPLGVPYNADYLMEDAPWSLTYDGGKQTWAPQNYEKTFRGSISLRTALTQSVNTVTAKLGQQVGLPAIAETARLLGVRSELPLVPSLSLGVAELAPLELAQVYCTLANHGVRIDLISVRAITESDGKEYLRITQTSQPVIDPAVTDLTTDILKDVLVSGTAKSALKMGFQRPAAGKTGTTSHHRDAWFAGYTPQLTSVVWVGVDHEISQKLNLTGASAALPIWVSFMNQALQNKPIEPFQP
ncbi:MAG: transglycosylase domain-containing protein [Bdellovibrionia bacterium]